MTDFPNLGLKGKSKEAHNGTITKTSPYKAGNHEGIVFQITSCREKHLFPGLLALKIDTRLSKVLKSFPSGQTIRFQVNRLKPFTIK